MRFLVDECTGPAVARWLREQGYDVFSVYEQDRGATDDSLLKRAFQENRILLTNDKDFGDKTFRDRKPHHGIILLRLDDERAGNKISVLRRLFENYSDKLLNNYIVVTEEKVRIAKG
jgi:predicted nuclease of predicted toxin-antitoxin system